MRDKKKKISKNGFGCLGEFITSLGLKTAFCHCFHDNKRFWQVCQEILISSGHKYKPLTLESSKLHNNLVLWSGETKTGLLATAFVVKRVQVLGENNKNLISVVKYGGGTVMLWAYLNSKNLEDILSG